MPSSRPLTGGSRHGWLKGRKDSRSSLAHAPLSYGAMPGKRWSPKRVVVLVVGAVVVIGLFSMRRTVIQAEERRMSQDQVERIWRWEIASGRYPQRKPIPITFTPDSPIGPVVENPAVPSSDDSGLRQGPPGHLRPVGAPRSYYPLQANPRTNAALPNPPQSSGPTRPQPGAVLDMDVMMRHCDFSLDQYVRDCLDVLRVNGGLDGGMRYGSALKSWEMTYQEEEAGVEGAVVGRGARGADVERVARAGRVAEVLNSTADDFADLVQAQHKLTLAGEAAPFTKIVTGDDLYPSLDPACDPAHPRIFHIFWVGAFTDKPYSAILSFLYTQNLHLNLPLDAPPPAGVCRPQLWMWITPPPGSTDANARERMHAELLANPWSAPLLDRRFEGAVKFLLWNTTEQLDATVEMEGWREFPVFKEAEEAPPSTVTVTAAASADPNNPNGPAVPAKKKVELVGSTSDKYDRVSTTFSDMVRFVLTHRFGGIYLDADTLLLRDWEELFNYKGAFAYRWSRMTVYNTAVLKMDKGTALGSAIFKLAIANGLKFHPMDVSAYLAEAQLDQLLLRVPDALFDSAWLNADYPRNFQRDRPPFPFFKDFEDFFKTPKEDSAAPSALGFDAFFRGAFSYHWHNFWPDPFDPVRDWPELGDRFASAAGAALRNEALSARRRRIAPPVASGAAPGAVPLAEGLAGVGVGEAERAAGVSLSGVAGLEVEQTELGMDEDEADLSWASVMKRTFEGFVRGERGNAYGEWIEWAEVDGRLVEDQEGEVELEGEEEGEGEGGYEEE